MRTVPIDGLQDVSLPLDNLIATAVVVVVVVGLRFLVLRSVQRRVEDPTVWYRSRKTGTYVTVAVLALVLGAIWLEGVRGMATFLGLLSAGIAIALGDLLKNLAGWLFITVRRPLRVGDRIEIGEHAGDVVDVRAFRFSLLEIRNWVDADQSTGRILHVPNGMIFTETLANFGAAFPWIWHEVPVLITFESDWERAQEILQRILDEHTPDVARKAARESLRKAARKYLISFTHLTPTVYVDVRDSGVLLTGRLLCDVRARRGVTHGIWSALLREFAADASLELAYPTVRSYLHGPIRIEQERSAGDGQATGGVNAPHTSEQ